MTLIKINEPDRDLGKARIYDGGRRDIDYTRYKPKKPRSQWTTGRVRFQVPNNVEIKGIDRDYDLCRDCGGYGKFWKPAGFHGRVKRLTICHCRFGDRWRKKDAS